MVYFSFSFSSSILTNDRGYTCFSFCDFYICPKYHLFRIFLVLFSEGFFLNWFFPNAKGYYHIQVLPNIYINSRVLILYYQQASQLLDSQMEVTQVDQCESDTLDGNIIEKNDSTKGVMKVCRKTRTTFWFKDTTFDTVDEAKALIKNGSSKHYTNIQMKKEEFIIDPGRTCAVVNDRLRRKMEKYGGRARLPHTMLVYGVIP